MGYSAEERRLLGERDTLAEGPPEFDDRWVVYADIEGFSKMVSKTIDRFSLAHLYWDLARSLYLGTRHHRALGREAAGFTPIPSAGDPNAFTKQMLDLWRRRVRIFSDSIFVFMDPRLDPPNVTDPSDSLDGRFVPDVAATLSRTLWSRRLPHKGGIAFGSCLIDPELNAFMGEPIVKAYQWACRQEWLGISVEPESLAAASIDFKNEPFQVSCSVPTKSAEVATIASNCTEGKMFDARQGSEVFRDCALDGFLEAFEHAKATQCEERILNRYRKTARLWLDRFQLDEHLLRLSKLREVVG